MRGPLVSPSALQQDIEQEKLWNMQEMEKLDVRVEEEVKEDAETNDDDEQHSSILSRNWILN